VVRLPAAAGVLLQGVGGVRPYSYWLFGDLATVVVAAGLASAAGIGRVLRFPWRENRAVVLLGCAFLLAIVAADLSGMSKAETERIWLPFTLWLPATAALLPRGDRRGWLAAQGVVALLINHLLLTGW
jgi:methylthioxylose transferase